ncbi:hypothetical protein [Flavobacterium sp. ABG]|jgi:hypothetical protein|uniref:hypothetical protein n=1 Tax=Flavobacterium sp. ABG TaxID=1423322 RepID=UPI00064ACF35|nr:hypothetical protein [Flavobacterium sp. ABG]KLT68482.1 hypothetical protein AB674_17615 [Flavobacterium sp. ABG]
MLKKKYILILLLVFCNYYVNAQQGHFRGRFKNALDRCKLIFKQPNNYIKVDSSYEYDPIPTYLHGLLLYSIKNKHDDLIIAFTMIEVHEPNELLKKMFPKSAEINNIIPYLINEADSTISSPIKIDEKKLKELSADNGYIYNMKIVYPYLGKYPLCRKVLIHKDNVSNAQILYFYTKKDEDKVDDVIQKTWGMLKFEK